MGPLIFVLALVVTISTVVATLIANRQAVERIDRILAKGKQELAAGQLDRAVMTLGDLIEGPTTPAREEGLYLLGQTLEQLGRTLEAERAYKTYMSESRLPKDTERSEVVKERLAEMAVLDITGLSPWQEFLAEREDRLGTPASRWFGLRDGRDMLEARRLEEALPIFQRLVHTQRLDAPAREHALLYLGLTFEAMERRAEAREVYRRYRREYVARPESHNDPEVQALARERLRVVEDDAEEQDLPWEVFEQILLEARRRLALPEGEAAVEAKVAEASEARPPEVAQAPPALLRSPEQLAADLGQLNVGRKLGPYVLAEKLGEGGFGEVFRALQEVAVKIARGPEDVERLRRLAELQAKVQSERIVQPLAVELAHDPPYVVLELVEGATLRDLLEERRLPPATALALLGEIAAALRDVHAAGLAHLDLKPENVLLGEAGAVKLTDFDLALSREREDPRAVAHSLRFTQEGPAGTLAYMSPEQRQGERPDARSDVYTFGLCLFEALTGTLPEPGDKPSDFVEDLPGGVDELFARCFSRRERRYADAAELLADREPILERLPEPERVSELVAALPKRERSAESEASESEAAESEASESEAAESESEASEPESESEASEPESESEAFEPEPESESEPEPGAAEPESSDMEQPSLDALIAARAARAREAEMDAQEAPDGEGPDLLEEGA